MTRSSDHEQLRSGRIRVWWERFEGPTFVVAVAVYGGWTLLIAYHRSIPWWLTAVLGAFVVAWHGSLQHETIDALVRVPRPVRTLLAWPPLGLWFPYSIYHHTHRLHHRCRSLTDSSEDPESYYHDASRWSRYPRLIRFVYLANQTLLGRLIIGPFLQVTSFWGREARLVIRGDRRRLGDWVRHALSVGGLFAVVTGIAGVPWWEYVVLIAYPGASLSMLRSFTEHRYCETATQRTALVESGFLLALLFLNNNLHVVHHHAPTIPWYRLPSIWDAHREDYRREAGELYFSSYREIAKRWLFRPAFVPVEEEAA
jgi:fatty acid desaturase